MRAACIVVLALAFASGPTRASGAPATLADLPVVAVPPAKSGDDRMVVLLSGDGGWAGLVRSIASALAADGIGVAGLDSLKYFWQERTPEQTARDIQRIAEHYAGEWRARRLVFIGFSFGADVLPVVLNRLPEDLRARVSGLTLIAPSSVANFEVKVTGWLGVSHPGLPMLPELERLRGLPMLCIYGESDVDAVCAQLPAGLARTRVLPGGHHFGGDFDAVARLVLPVP